MMVSGFGQQVLIRLPGSLLTIILLGLAGWFAVLFLRRRTAAAPAGGRTLRLLVVLARPLTSRTRQGAERRHLQARVMVGSGWSGEAAPAPGLPLSCELLEQAFLGSRASITARYLRMPSLSALGQVLPQGYDALLFAGPVLPDGSLAFEGRHGEQDVIAPDELGRRLQAGNVRLVYLSSCYSPRAARALRGTGILAVAGSAEDGRPDLQAGFVAGFFTALARGRNVYQAFAGGRKAIAGRSDGQAGRAASFQLSAWRWPALRLVLSGSTEEYADESPPLPTPAPPPVDLVGRGADLLMLNRQLAQHRLVTVVGQDGTGRTALARAVARWHWERGLAQAGAHLIPLDGLRRGRDLADRLLYHLAPDYRPLAALDETGLLRHQASWLSSRLGQEEWLLVLDGIGPVLDDEARWLLQKLLSQCRRLRLLLTGGEPAELAEEHVHVVRPLARAAAAELFRRRAKLPVAESDRGPVLAICQALDHVPLAIRLVASSGQRSWRETLQELQAASLQPGSASADAGQCGPAAAHARPLHGVPLALAFGYSRLSVEAQRLFCALSVFRGGATREAIQAVTAGLVRCDQAIEELLDRDLLEQGQVDGAWLYWQSPAVAEHARQCCLRDACRLDLDMAVLYGNHAAHYLQVARRVNALLSASRKPQPAAGEVAQPPGLSERETQQQTEQSALGLLGGEKPNLLAAVEGACQAGAWDLAWRLAKELFTSLPIRPCWDEEERAYLLALEATRRAGDPCAEGEMLNQLGSIYRLQGRWARATAYYKQHLAIQRELSDRQGEAGVLRNLGLLSACQERWAEAATMLEQALELLRDLDDRPGQGLSLKELGTAYAAQGHWAEAGLVYQQSLEILRQVGDRSGEGQVLAGLAQVSADQGHWDRSVALSQASLAIFQQQGDRRGELGVLNNLGRVYRLQGHWALAVQCHERCLAICRQLVDRRGQGQALRKLGDIQAEQGCWAEAGAMYERSLDLFRELEDRRGEGQILASMGSALSRQVRWAEAVAVFRQGLDVFREAGDRHGEGQVLASLGDAYADQGCWAQAVTCYEQDLSLYRELGDRHGEGRMLSNLGAAYSRQERWSEAITASQRALRVFQEMGARLDEGRMLRRLGDIHCRHGRWAEAVDCYAQNLSVCHELGDCLGEESMLANLGDIYAVQDCWEEATLYYERQLALCRKVGDRRREGQALANLANSHGQRGRYVQAVRAFQRSLRICRELADRRGEGRALTGLAMVYAHQQRWAEAFVVAEQGLGICRELGDRQGEGQMLVHLARAHAGQAHWSAALAMYEQGLQVFRELAERREEGRTWTRMGDIYYLQGRWPEAIACYEQNLAICREMADHGGEGRMLSSMGDVYARQGCWDEAAGCYQRLVACCRGAGDRRGEGKALSSLGNLYADQGRWREAISMVLEALRIHRELGDRYGEGKMLTNLGLIYARQGMDGIAIARWFQALYIFATLGAAEAEQIRGWLRKQGIG